MTDEEKDQESGHVWPEPSEEQTREVPPTEEQTQRKGPRRLLRSSDDRVIAGVAGGLSRYFNVDPVIFRIGFVVSIFFGGLGGLVYLAAALFVPVDDGAGRPAEGSRWQGLGRLLVVGALAVAAIAGFAVLTAAGAFVTGIGYGLAVVAVIVVIGVALVVTSFHGGARWLVVPALALTIGAGAAVAADLDLEGGVGERDYHPASAAAIPADGYELGVGRLAVDLRDIDWSPQRVLDLHVRVGAGQAVIAVPSDVCVTGTAHAAAGDLLIAGERSDGTDVDADVAGGSTATPRLVLHGDVDLGQIQVVNDDDVEITDSNRFDRFDVDEAAARDANAKACAA
jgi:phage shock protein PspC (stress-responsive transcriptional regulator)